MQQKVKTDRKVILHGGSASAEAHLVDLSISGIGVTSSRGAKVGTELDAEFEVPALQRFITFKIHGKVTHRHNVGDEIYLHIEFMHMTHEEKTALQDFIDYKQRLSQSSKRTFD
ncbi:MAG: PilZ domain-containing protein [Pseudomonadota bacterium]|nr:PilZ domain-containing protein [Pseudomonadota bacterium]